MISISVRSDLRDMQRLLTDFERRQLPFALSLGLNRTAKAAEGDVTRNLPSAFDKPTPFTERAIAIKPAPRGGMQAEVFVRPLQAKYLAPQERGGTRQPKKKALVTPVGVKLNQYGNIPNRGLRRAAARRDTFVGQVRGVGGFWQRTKEGGLKLLARFDGAKPVKRTEWFMPTVTVTVRREFPRQMADAMRQAMRTARR